MTDYHYTFCSSLHLLVMAALWNTAGHYTSWTQIIQYVPFITSISALDAGY